MTLGARLLGVDDSAWPAFLRSTRHDFFHLPGYVALDASSVSGEPVAMLVEDRTRALLLPMVLRDIPGGTRDAVSPYGYPGPLVRAEAGSTFVADALARGIELLASHQIVSLFVRAHPILNDRLPEGPWTIVHQGDTVAVDLTLGPTEHWRQTRRDHRTQIRRAERVGYVAAWDPDLSHYADFQRLYHATMVRRAADSSYLLGETYFDGLRRALGEHLRLAVTKMDEVVVAAGLFVDCDGVVQYFLSGSDARLQREAAWATKAMIHFVRGWAQAGGRQWLHLGGGVGGSEDTLFMFKAGFSPLRFAFQTLRAVVMPAEYERLVTRHDPTADPTALDGFFPAYRAP